jgi:hypothetical protein
VNLDMTGQAVRQVRADVKQVMSISEAASEGTRRDLLVALRDRLAVTMENQTIPGRDLSALSNRLLEIVNEIEAIDAQGGGDDVGNAAATPDERWTAA